MNYGAPVDDDWQAIWVVGKGCGAGALGQGGGGVFLWG